MKIEDFGGLCLTNAHLALGPNGRCPVEPGMTITQYNQKSSMTKVAHYHSTTDGNYHITTWGIVMPTNNGRPPINAEKAQEPMDS